MSFTTEHRGFAVGREVDSCGRCTRLVLGLLGLVYIGTSVAQMGPSASLIGHIAGGLLLTAILYIVLFWQICERVPHPWLRTVIFWLPAAFIFLPWGWGFGVLLYWSVACLLAALTAYGGCEVVAFPSLLFRRHLCCFSLERRSSTMVTSHYRYPVRSRFEQRRFLETMVHTSPETVRKTLKKASQKPLSPG